MEYVSLISEINFKIVIDFPKDRILARWVSRKHGSNEKLQPIFINASLNEWIIQIFEPNIVHRIFIIFNILKDTKILINLAIIFIESCKFCIPHQLQPKFAADLVFGSTSCPRKTEQISSPKKNKRLLGVSIDSYS